MTRVKAFAIFVLSFKQGKKMNTVRLILAFVVIIASALGGIYVGLWEMLVMGIVNVVSAVKAEELDTGLLAWGLLKFFCSWVGWVVFLIGCVIAGLISPEVNSLRKRKKARYGKFKI